MATYENWMAYFEQKYAQEKMRKLLLTAEFVDFAHMQAMDGVWTYHEPVKEISMRRWLNSSS